jgi:hypothetical protein
MQEVHFRVAKHVSQIGLNVNVLKMLHGSWMIESDRAI